MDSRLFLRIRISFLFIINSFSVIFYLLHSSIPPLELTNQMIITGILWCAFLLLPAIISLFFKASFMRWGTFIFGIIASIINLLLSFGYLADNQLSFGILIFLFWGGISISATIISYKWIKAK